MNTRNVVDPKDLAHAAQLLIDFNREYDEPTPELGWFANHLARLIEAGDTSVLAYGTPGIGVAVLRFRTGTWTDDQEAYLAEFYIQPDHRGLGHGTVFLDGVITYARERGATYMDLTTNEDDEAARHVYEKRGFDCHEGRPDGTTSFYYELDIS